MLMSGRGERCARCGRRAGGGPAAHGADRVGGSPRCKNAVFAIRSEEKAFNIAQALEGRAGQKAPQQTIEGNWVKMTPEDIYKQIKETLAAVLMPTLPKTGTLA